MRVVKATRFGGPEVLVTSEAPDPVAGLGQVVVGVAVAPVLFLETQIRSGWGGEWFTVTPPYVPGNGVAGQVISVGEGVNPDWVGRRVITDTGERGGYAEQALSEAAAGRIIPVIGQTFPLERAADAHTAIEARNVIGKTLLLI